MKSNAINYINAVDYIMLDTTKFPSFAIPSFHTFKQTVLWSKSPPCRPNNLHPENTNSVAQ